MKFSVAIGFSISMASTITAMVPMLPRAPSSSQTSLPACSKHLTHVVTYPATTTVYPSTITRTYEYPCDHCTISWTTVIRGAPEDTVATVTADKPGLTMVPKCVDPKVFLAHHKSHHNGHHHHNEKQGHHREVKRDGEYKDFAAMQKMGAYLGW
ncbi:hypothetical protein TWF694_005375 [Orbilia ellipsospora]|uniref:Uncharacterized protein n=1 Tax=Orbilia ellipsospora TaxID=2528407 RepID=A0AAV9WV34_9PEZI